jgi:hypothetical protein
MSPLPVPVMSTAANLLSRAKKILGVDKVEAICRPGYYRGNCCIAQQLLNDSALYDAKWFQACGEAYVCSFWNFRV